MLVLEAPEVVNGLLRRETVGLASARAGHDENPLAGLIEFAVPDELAGNELLEPLEELVRERIEPAHLLGLLQEAKRPPKIRVAQNGHRHPRYDDFRIDTTCARAQPWLRDPGRLGRSSWTNRCR
jgi:hypothetical protein